MKPLAILLVIGAMFLPFWLALVALLVAVLLIMRKEVSSNGL